jgi:hypothetical protein
MWIIFNELSLFSVLCFYLDYRNQRRKIGKKVKMCIIKGWGFFKINPGFRHFEGIGGFKRFSSYSPLNFPTSGVL